MFVPSQIFSAFFSIANVVAYTSACAVAYAVTYAVANAVAYEVAYAVAYAVCYAVAYDFFSISVFLCLIRQLGLKVFSVLFQLVSEKTTKSLVIL